MCEGFFSGAKLVLVRARSDVQDIHEPGVPPLLSDDNVMVFGSPARGHDRWVINKIRALCSWYSKGLDGGSQLRVRINSADSVAQLRDIIDEFFSAAVVVG